MEKHALLSQQLKHGVLPWVKWLVLKYWPVAFAFVLIANGLRGINMIAIGGDAENIWQSIMSMANGEEIVPSYVMYKGFFSVYPYVWLVQLGHALGLSEFFFVKIFHCVLFTYATAIGFPKVFEHLTNKPAKSWRIALFVFIVYKLWGSNHAFWYVMIDLPCLAYFLLLVNSAFAITKLDGKISVGRFLYTGVLFGMNIGFAGQYKVAAIVVLLYVVIKLFPRKIFRNGKKIGLALLSLFIVFAGTFGMVYNEYRFETNVVNALRDNGSTIMDSGNWLEANLESRENDQRDFSQSDVPNIRDTTVQQKMEDDGTLPDYENRVTTLKDYIFERLLRFPMDYLVTYGSKLFMILSPTQGTLGFVPLFIGYTLLFVALVIFFKRCKTVKNFFSTKLLMCLAFLLAVAPCIVMRFEFRYVMQLQGFIFSIALFDDVLWDGFKAFGKTIAATVKSKSIKVISQYPLPKTFLKYILFLIICFSFIAALNDISGAYYGSELLFSIW